MTLTASRLTHFKPTAHHHVPIEAAQLKWRQPASLYYWRSSVLEGYGVHHRRQQKGGHRFIYRVFQLELTNLQTSMLLANSLANDETIPRPRAFQISALEVDSKSEIEGDSPMRRLSRGEIIAYVDRYAIVIKVSARLHDAHRSRTGRMERRTRLGSP